MTGPAVELPPILRAQHLSREFDGVHAVDDVSFDVVGGQAVGLIGPNGAGKSTACGLLAGTIRPSHGAVIFDDAVVTGLPAHDMARKGLIRTFQLSADCARMTVLENVVLAAPRQRGETLLGAMLGRRYWGREERQHVERAADLLVQVGLGSMLDDYAGTLSGGQKRLLEIARALMAEPRFLLLDEPMAGVHVNIRARIVEQLAILRDKGLTMMIVEHELDVIETLCDRVIVMARGRVLAEGTMDELRSRQTVVDAYLVG